MKKIFIIIMVILITCLISIFTNNVYAAELTLSDIVNKFNENSDGIYEDLDIDGVVVEATATETGISVSYTYESETFQNTWDLSDGVLQGTINMEMILSSFLESWGDYLLDMTEEDLPTEQLDENSINILKEFMKAYEYMGLIVSIGELQGYTYDYMVGILTLQEMQEYTIENEGISVTNSDNEEEALIEMKVSIQHMNLDVDMDVVYFEISDLTDNFILAQEKGQKGYLYYYKDRDLDANVIISIAQKTELSDITYKSIESMIEKMYGNSEIISQYQGCNTAFNEKTAVNYFKSFYANLDAGSYDANGVKVEINPVITSNETDFIDQNHDFVRLTIDSGEFEEKLLAYINELSPSTIVVNDDDNDGEYEGNLPDTGRKMEISDYIALAFLTSVGFTVFFFVQARVKSKIEKDV